MGYAYVNANRNTHTTHTTHARTIPTHQKPQQSTVFTNTHTRTHPVSTIALRFYYRGKHRYERQATSERFFRFRLEPLFFLF